MAKKKTGSVKQEQKSDLFSQSSPVPAPPFESLLSSPVIKDALPRDFNVREEAEHLRVLWQRIDKLRRYSFANFVHAGGSGIVFKVFREGSDTPLAMKVARKKLIDTNVRDAANALSPVSESELKALERLSHPHVVRLYDALEEPGTTRVTGIVTTFVEAPSGIDTYLRQTLDKDPDPKGLRGLHPFSPQRLDDACRFLLVKCQEIAGALEHMHSLRIYHFDIKPANILISDTLNRPAVLTDMGSCIHADQLETAGKIRVHFTWTYAHPDLTNIIHDPGSISGGGLRASASIDVHSNLEAYDLYALGRTIQEALAILVEEFGERCYASYGFRYLHFIACLLLDGHNAPSPGTTRAQKRFVDDVAMGYPTDLFALHRIRTATELVNRLARFSREYSWSGHTPELDPAQPDTVNTGYGLQAPFTNRVSNVFKHPAMRRLKDEPQLGWIREVYPGATHTRWSHSLGVFASMVSMLNALLSDPEVPTFRVLCDPDDIRHALVAATVHDLGQSAFGHDLEEVSAIFSHDQLTRRLLEDPHWGETLAVTIERNWRGAEPSGGRTRQLDVKRVLAILGRNHDPADARRAIDGVASDCVSGPVDADKLDYIRRDSIACGVPYGQGMDPHRLLSAISVTALHEKSRVRLALAYKAKGRPAIESMLIARYQMFGAVYWHHTFRCIHAMFGHAAHRTFGALGNGSKKMRGTSFSSRDIQELFYQKVILGKSWTETREAFKGFSHKKQLPEEFTQEFSAPISSERAIEFVYRFADDSTRKLLDALLARNLFKRIFEVRLGELGPRGDYSATKGEFTAEKRTRNAEALQDKLLDAVNAAMQSRGPRESITENAARTRLEELRHSEMPLVVIDFPVRGVASDYNVPREISDSYRKYFAIPTRDRGDDDDVFHVVRSLQMRMAAVRVYVTPEFHDLIIRYLHSDEIAACMSEVMPFVTV